MGSRCCQTPCAGFGIACDFGNCINDLWCAQGSNCSSVDCEGYRQPSLLWAALEASVIRPKTTQPTVWGTYTSAATGTAALQARCAAAAMITLAARVRPAPCKPTGS